MTSCRLLFLLAAVLFLLFVTRVEPFRPGVGSPYMNTNTHILGKQNSHTLSLLKHLP